MDETLSLTSEDRAVLLRFAREAIEATAGGRKLPELKLSEIPLSLRRVASSFVTIFKQGQLRGCIGGLKADLPLAQDVRLHAAAAASRDPRFVPVQQDELAEIEIEISILSEPQPLDYVDPGDLLEKLEPGKDGVVLEVGEHRATFLPQVWERAPSSEDFLGMLCQKAQLPADYWLRHHPEIKTYRVQKIHESLD